MRREIKELDFLLLDQLREADAGLLRMPLSAVTKDLNLSSRYIGEAKLNKKIAEKIASRINLIYVPQEEGNVCLANSREVIPEFRKVCTTKDLLHYVSGLLLSFNISDQEVVGIRLPYPHNALSFWRLVQEGADDQ